MEVIPNGEQPITLYCDNSGAVANSKEPRSHKRSKRIERKYNLIRDIVARGDVEVKKYSLHNNIIDPFIKYTILQNVQWVSEGLRLEDYISLL